MSPRKTAISRSAGCRNLSDASIQTLRRPNLVRHHSPDAYQRYNARMHIEPMTDADHAEVSDLLRACFNWLADREGFTDRQREFLIGPRSSVETVREESRTRPHLVARDPDGTILGMAAIREDEIARLYVHPRYHSRGVGKALFNAAESMIHDAGFTEVTVAALVESAAAFYRARGMREFDRQSYEPEIFTDRQIVLLSKPAEHHNL